MTVEMNWPASWGPARRKAWGRIMKRYCCQRLGAQAVGGLPLAPTRGQDGPPKNFGKVGGLVEGQGQSRREEDVQITEAGGGRFRHDLDREPQVPDQADQPSPGQKLGAEKVEGHEDQHQGREVAIHLHHRRARSWRYSRPLQPAHGRDQTQGQTQGQPRDQAQESVPNPAPGCRGATPRLPPHTPAPRESVPIASRS